MQKSPTSRKWLGGVPLRHRRSLLVVAFAVAFASLPGFVAAQSSGTNQAQPPASSKASADQPFDLADEVARDVLTGFQRGVESHSLSLVLSVFDAQDMTDYDDFREQMAAFFRAHDNIKFRYQLLQVSADKDAGFAIADVEMDPEPRDILPAEHRRSAQMRFELKRTPAGWRALGLKPMDFFTQ